MKCYWQLCVVCEGAPERVPLAADEMVASFFISWWKLSNHFGASLILTYNSPEGLGGGCGSGGFLLLTKSENKVLLQAEKKVSLWSDVAIVKWRFLCEIIRIRSFRVLNTRREKKSEFTTSFCSLSLDKTGSMQRESSTFPTVATVWISSWFFQCFSNIPFESALVCFSPCWYDGVTATPCSV